jgi:hypothetical protein
MNQVENGGGRKKDKIYICMHIRYKEKITVWRRGG